MSKKSSSRGRGGVRQGRGGYWEYHVKVGGGYREFYVVEGEKQ